MSWSRNIGQESLLGAIQYQYNVLSAVDSLSQEEITDSHIATFAVEAFAAHRRRSR